MISPNFTEEALKTVLAVNVGMEWVVWTNGEKTDVFSVAFAGDSISDLHFQR
jgi:hypothetical protein